MADVINLANRGNLCLTASCLAHRQKMFLQGWGEDADRWCHLNGYPCEEDPDVLRDVP